MADSKVVKDIFISYGRQPDVIRFVKQLKQDLEMNGFSVWLDSEDIRSGTDWRAEITTGLDDCRVIIPVITQKYISSRYCVNELYAADAEQKLIFPIMFEDVDFSVSDTAKGVKFVVSGINWTMCRPGVDDYASSLEKLVTGMREKAIGVQSVTESKEQLGDGMEKLSIAVSNSTKDALPMIPQSTKPIKTIFGFKNPNGIAVSHDKKIIVTNMGTNEVLVYDEDYEKIGTIGGEGIEPGKFYCPQGVAVDHDNHVIITCYTMHCVQKFTVDGKFLKAAGKAGNGEFEFQAPNGLAVSKDGGKVYVCDQGNNRVQILSNDLTFLGNFSLADPEYGSGSLNHPNGIAINSEGNLFIADMMNHCVQVFNPEGQFISRIGKQGHTGGCLISPMCIAIDKDDLLYVADGSCRISTFTKHGLFVRMFGGHGSELGKFTLPRGICVDGYQKLYICEWNANRVQIFL